MKFEFDDDFQNRILASLIHSTRFLKTARDLVEPEYFSSNDQWVLCSLVYQFYDRYKKAPKTVDLKNEVVAYCKKGNISPEAQELLETLRKRLKKTVRKDKSYITDEIIKFTQHEKTRLALENFIPQFNDGKGHGDVLTEFTEELIEIGKFNGGETAIRADRLTLKARSWLWRPYLPIGATSLLAGDGGVGKGFIELDIAARLSRRDFMPDGKHKAEGTTLIISAEDDPNLDLGPRLVSQGAEMKNIVLKKAIYDLSTPEGHRRLEQLIERYKPILVIIDPLTSYTGKLRLNNDSEIRQNFMNPLETLAIKYQCCILLVMHLNKGDSKNPLYKVKDSVGIPAAARSVMLVGQHWKDETQRGFFHIKVNNAERGKPLGYDITENTIEIEGDDIEIGKLTWDRETNLNVYDVIGVEGKEETKTEQSAKFVRTYMKGHDERDAAEAIKMAKAFGLTPNNLVVGRRKEGIIATQAPGYWVWRRKDRKKKKKKKRSRYLA